MQPSILNKLKSLIRLAYRIAIASNVSLDKLYKVIGDIHEQEYEAAVDRKEKQESV